MAGQQAITQHFNIKSLYSLKKMKSYQKYYEMCLHVVQVTVHTKSPELTPILQNLLINVQNNTCLLSKQRRHLDVIKKFATIFYIYSGSMAYEFLHHNMPQVIKNYSTVGTVPVLRRRISV